MSAEFDQPVFIIGSARSGTTLVYSMLLSSGDFAIYEAETLLFEVCQPRYGNIKRSGNFKKFIDDWVQSKQFFRSGLNPFKFKKEAIKHHASYTDFLKFFMESIASNQGKRRWAEQTPSHLFQIKILAKAFPNAKFIHVIRDGRAVALSKRRLGWTGTKSEDPLKQLLYAALTWERSIKKGQEYGEKIKSHYKEIRYEDIIDNLERILEEINSFANTKIDLKKLQNSNIGSLGKGNTAFNGRMEGISAKGKNRWKKNLSNLEIQALNLSIGKTLKKLGYEMNNFEGSGLSLPVRKIITLSFFFRTVLNIKDLVKQKTMLGRLTSDHLEIGLH